MKKRRKGLWNSGVFVCLTALMIVTMIAHAGTLSAMDQTSFYGIRPEITYAEDAASATITLNTADINTDEIDVKEILDYENKPLSLSNPQITVTQNGEYAFTIKYSEKKAMEAVVAEDTVNEQNQASEEIVEPEKTDEESGESAIKNGVEAEKTDSRDEVKSFVMNARVDGIQALNTDAASIDESESDGVDLKGNATEATQPEVAATAESRDVPSNSNLAEIFDLTQMRTLKGTPITNATSWKPSVEGNKIIGYDARNATSMPDSEANSGGRWDASTVLPAKSRVSLRQNWTFKGNVILPVAFPNSTYSINYSTNVIISEGTWVGTTSNEYAVLGLNADSKSSVVNFYTRNRGTPGGGVAGAYNYSAPMAISYTYKDGGSGEFSIEYAGNKANFIVNNLPETADMTLHTQVQYGSTGDSTTQKDFPKIRAGFEFGEFGYRDYDPQLLGATWYDASGAELVDGSVVKGGDTLTVKVTMKNNTTTEGKANVLLKLSDDSTIASTHGVDPDADITNGIITSLSKNTVTKVFTVKVRDDAIGNISLGLMMEDDFFHNKQYAQLQSKIDVGQVFVDGSPQIKVVEAKRNSVLGNMIGTAEGEPSFINSTDQTLLNQDSYVRVTVVMVNPRYDIDLSAKVSLNTGNAAGLDFDHVYDVRTEGLGTTLTAQDVRTMLSTGKTLDYKVSPGGESSISFVVPVKQDANGAPFNTEQQKIEAVVEGTITLNGNSAKGEWRREVKISDSIIDIDSWLNLSEIQKDRGDSYDLMETYIKTAFRTKHPSSSYDPDSVTTKNQGTAADWKYFGLRSETDLTGTIPYFTDTGKEMKIDVSFNKSVIIDGKKHWTRKGSDLNAPFRIQKKTITLKVKGGTEIPTAYFEIPKTVYLNDREGIDDDHAGMKEEISLVAGVETAKSFDVTADNIFRIGNTAGQEHIVTLYDGSGTAYGASAPGSDKAFIGTFNNTTRTKTVWFNLVKDQNRKASEYKGTMNFYIKMN